MIEGFFFDRINMYSHGPAIDQAAHLPLDIYPGSAFPPLSLAEGTSLCTEDAFYEVFAVLVLCFRELFAHLVALNTTDAWSRG
jgi:hypothetical protein